MDKKYQPTIGLEIHAELNTRTKMFCSSPNSTEAKEPNINVCPICLGHPGTLPVINKTALRHVLMVGLALGGELADFTRFDRKNYFYPDLPKGYQISQYEHPLVSGGELAGVKITRVHLEEDTASLMHIEGGNYSILDFNRAGVPLMELVTEPVIECAEKAAEFARELQLLLRHIGASDANMEKGQMRLEANISVSRKVKGQKMGTKVEIKNLNSIRAMKDAVAFEIKRQREILESGGTVVQETRGWKEKSGETFSQRVKEDAYDYRYFPEPDLPSLELGAIPEFSRVSLEKDMPALPWEIREKYLRLGLSAHAAEHYVVNRKLGDFFDAVAELCKNDKNILFLASNYITSDLAGIAQHFPEKAFALEPKKFFDLMLMASRDEISSRGAKDILLEMVVKGGAPGSIAEKKNLFQKNSDNELEEIARFVIEANKDAAAAVRSGKSETLKFLVGQGMKKSGGSANPQKLSEIIKKNIYDSI